MWKYETNLTILDIIEKWIDSIDKFEQIDLDNNIISKEQVKKLHEKIILIRDKIESLLDLK